jgi:hypothetical protein
MYTYRKGRGGVSLRSAGIGMTGMNRTTGCTNGHTQNDHRKRGQETQLEQELDLLVRRGPPNSVPSSAYLASITGTYMYIFINIHDIYTHVFVA